MQEHLCRTLAHYAVYLSFKLGLPIQGSKEQFVLEFAHSMWNKEGHFVWTTREEEHSDDADDAPVLEDDFSRIDVDKWAFHLSEYYSTGHFNSSQSQHEKTSNDFNPEQGFEGLIGPPTIQEVPRWHCGYVPDLGSNTDSICSPTLPLKIPKALGIFDYNQCADWVGPIPLATCLSGFVVPQRFLLV
jgi:hypothetical protein